MTKQFEFIINVWNNSLGRIWKNVPFDISWVCESKVTEQLTSHNEMLLSFEIIVNILIKALDEEVSSVPVPKPLNNGRD